MSSASVRETGYSEVSVNASESPRIHRTPQTRKPEVKYLLFVNVSLWPSTDHRQPSPIRRVTRRPPFLLHRPMAASSWGDRGDAGALSRDRRPGLWCPTVDKCSIWRRQAITGIEKPRLKPTTADFLNSDILSATSRPHTLWKFMAE